MCKVETNVAWDLFIGMKRQRCWCARVQSMCTRQYGYREHQFSVDCQFAVYWTAITLVYCVINYSPSTTVNMCERWLMVALSPSLLHCVQSAPSASNWSRCVYCQWKICTLTYRHQHERTVDTKKTLVMCTALHFVCDWLTKVKHNTNKMVI